MDTCEGGSSKATISIHETKRQREHDSDLLQRGYEHGRYDAEKTAFGTEIVLGLTALIAIIITAAVMTP